MIILNRTICYKQKYRAPFKAIQIRLNLYFSVKTMMLAPCLYIRRPSKIMYNLSFFLTKIYYFRQLRKVLLEMLNSILNQTVKCHSLKTNKCSRLSLRFSPSLGLSLSPLLSSLHLIRKIDHFRKTG